jgi:hypothetical protein
MDQGYATVNASAFFCNMAGCANRSITELIRLMGRRCLAPESGAGKRRWLDPTGAHISDLDRGPWISWAIGTWPKHLRSNAPAMPDTLYKCTAISWVT